MTSRTLLAEKETLPFSVWIRNHVRNFFELSSLKSQIRSERNALSELSDRELKDIGITRDQANFEANRAYDDIPQHRKTVLQCW